MLKHETDVPSQYKTAVDYNVVQVMYAAEDLMAIGGELGGVSIELESGDIVVRIEKKTKDSGLG